MINGAHVLLYSTDPQADRDFFRDVLKFPCVDAGEGWLIFKLPPAEVAFHPSEEDAPRSHAGESLTEGVLYLMCDDLAGTVAALRANKVKFSAVIKAPWGSKTTFRLPGGGAIGLYQPFHPTAFDLDAGPRTKHTSPSPKTRRVEHSGTGTTRRETRRRKAR
jgi:catechol 2,3-dioxygenase-like lactoylglutathione lyase family enzyme